MRLFPPIMDDQILEPLSKKQCNEKLNIEVRGSLAELYERKLFANANTDAFLWDLIDSNSPDIVKILNRKGLVIGMKEDKGKFFPDW